MIFAIFAVVVGEIRTTVSIHPTPVIFLAFRLGEIPETPKAHQSTRQWLQNRINENCDVGRSRISQWLAGEVVQEITDPVLIERYAHWLDEQIN